MSRDEIELGLAILRRMRRKVARVASVHAAWPAAADCPARSMLLRHVIPGKPPFHVYNEPFLYDADDIPTAHALAWIDTAIAYAEEHGR